MMEDVMQDDDDDRMEFLQSLCFTLDYRKLLSLAIAMYTKYKKVCPNKLGIDLMVIAADDTGCKKVYVQIIITIF